MKRKEKKRKEMKWKEKIIWENKREEKIVDKRWYHRKYAMENKKEKDKKIFILQKYFQPELTFKLVSKKKISHLFL